MTKILLDTNIILDIALNHPPYADYARGIFGGIDKGLFEAYITASSVTDIVYVLRKLMGKEAAMIFLIELLDVVNVANVSSDVVRKAMHSDFADFEDAIQCYAAEAADIEFIITRNTHDFRSSTIPAYEPTEFLRNFK
jgi:predicted nucleic acid-binding protein